MDPDLCRACWNQALHSHGVLHMLPSHWQCCCVCRHHGCCINQSHIPEFCGLQCATRCNVAHCYFMCDMHACQQSCDRRTHSSLQAYHVEVCGLQAGVCVWCQQEGHADFRAAVSHCSGAGQTHAINATFAVAACMPCRIYTNPLAPLSLCLFLMQCVSDLLLLNIC